MSAAPIRAVLLDAAGTLVTVAAPVAETYARIAGEHGATLDEDALDAAFRTAFREMAPLAFGTGDAGARDAQERAWWRTLVHRVTEAGGGVARFDAFFDALYAHYAEPSAWRVYPETAAVLDALRARGLRLAVVSNFDSRLPPLLEALGVAARVDAVVWSAAAGAAKPDPRIFALALDRLGARAAEALHVGDSRHADYEGARAAGLAALLLDRRAAHPGGDAIATLDGVLDRV